MKNAPILHGLEYAFFQAFGGLLSVLPHEASRSIGTALGDLIWWIKRERRHIALSNIERAMPELSERQRRDVAIASFRHLGRVTCDTVSSYRFDRQEVCRRLHLEGWEHLEEARRRGRGVLVMSAHLGTWEMAAHPVGLYAEPMHVIGRPLDNPLLDRRLSRQRTRFGNATISKRGAARGSMKILRQKGIVGILIDQRVKPTEGGSLVPFFGHPALTSPLLGLLAIKTGAPIVPLFGHLADGGRYRVEFLPPIHAIGAGDEGVAATTRRCLEVVELQIRQSPGTWLWLHQRWKT